MISIRRCSQNTKRAALLLLAVATFLILPAMHAQARPKPFTQRLERPRVELSDSTDGEQVPPGVDMRPPRVVLRAPEVVERPRFGVAVDARDESGIAVVTISLDGVIVTGRTDPPYKFELSAARLPVRVKATATDMHGNTATDMAIVNGPPEPCICPEIYAPVCGVDGHTYGNACEADCAGVKVAYEGSCEAKPCGEDGEACGEAEFCELPPGTCGQTGEPGECREKPQVCLRHFDPVCGCDGRTYPNDCERQAAGVSLAHPGPCESAGCGGPLDSICGEDQFCELPPGTCDDSLVGQCVEQPEACLLTVYEPVCGCDGQTYGNDCERRAAGVSLLHPGPCEEMICGGRLMRPFDCPEGLFCERPPGVCSDNVEGRCTPQPEMCPLSPITADDAVCGCDGETYATDCERQKAGVSLAHRGPCREPAMCGGIAGFRCPEGQVCDMRDPGCSIADLAGECVPRPESCLRLWDPVCGCNGVTYANDCHRLQAGAVLGHPGECKPDCTLPPPDEWFTCEADSDCTVVDGIGCCACNMGGRQAAMRRDRVQESERIQRMCCADIACAAVVLCEPGLEAVCEEGKCNLRRPEE